MQIQYSTICKYNTVKYRIPNDFLKINIEILCQI